MCALMPERWGGFCPFLFLRSAACCNRLPSQQLCKISIHIHLLPLHVSALVGHLQVEYIQLIAGSYCTYNGSIVLCALVLL
jgi:hypothetical protein